MTWAVIAVVVAAWLLTYRGRRSPRLVVGSTLPESREETCMVLPKGKLNSR